MDKPTHRMYIQHEHTCVQDSLQTVPLVDKVLTTKHRRTGPSTSVLTLRTRKLYSTHMTFLEKMVRCKDIPSTRSINLKSLSSAPKCLCVTGASANNIETFHLNDEQAVVPFFGNAQHTCVGEASVYVCPLHYMYVPAFPKNVPVFGDGMVGESPIAWWS